MRWKKQVKLYDAYELPNDIVLKVPNTDFFEEVSQ